MSRGSARRFHFIRQVATGGFGTVYLTKVMHADGFSRIVAVKLLNAQWSDSEDVTRRIRDEARLLGLLRHRNIVNVIDLTSIEGRTAVVMEYLEAVDLRFLIQAMEEQGALVPVRACLELVSQVAGALDAAYNRPPMPGDKPLRVIHRDIKPSNIMVDDSGLPKILDFGVAQSEIETREANTQELQFGSVEYMAPERLFFEPETPASDVYSLGATLFELMCHERLGKARGRPERHAAHLVDRLSFMRSRTGIQGTAATEFELLLKESLDFEHENRPSAAEFHQRCRALSKLMDDEDLVSWAERELPPIIQAAHSRPQESAPLTNSILTEDSVAFRMDDDVSNPIDKPITGVAALRAREGERAEVLRKGALAELDDSKDVQVAPATGSPHADGRGARGPEGSERTDGVGWNDRTASTPTDQDLPEPTPLPSPLRRNMSAAVDAPEPPPNLTASSADLDRTEDTDAAHGMEMLRDEPPALKDLDVDITDIAGAQPLTPAPRPSFDNTLDGVDPPKRRSPALFVLIGGCLSLVVAVFIVGALVAGDVGGIRSAFQSEGKASGRGQPAVVPAPAAERAASDVLTEGSDEPGIRFVSKWKGTRKVTARCDGQTGRGKRRAFVPTESALKCSVTAIHTDMTRKTALVDVAEPGAYLCFVDGVSECNPR
jgi:serine/threonine protein kinase